MPSALSYTFYSVFTYKHLSCDINVFEDYVISYFKSLDIKKLIIVKELGKYKENPHLNVIIEYKTQTRADNLKLRYYKATYDKIVNEYEHTHNDMTVKAVYDADTLIIGYCMKEDDNQIIYNTGYDLESMKKTERFIHPKVDTRLLPVSLSLAPNIILAFAKENNMDVINKEQYKRIISRMISAGYDFSKVLGKFYYIFSVIRSKSNDDQYLDKLLDREFFNYETYPN